QSIRGFRADLCLLGICGIDLKQGISGADYQDSQIKKAMVETSKYIIALSTYEKIGVSDPYFVCATAAIDVFITEKDPTDEDLILFKENGLVIC
ncbi:MAG: DeoR/GlpR transcriptional regulator, partial [Mucilaginibacter sp.]